jgi:intein-encoded DNA endonuclease-like protein
LVSSRDELNDLYWGKKLTTAEIARLKGVRRRTVSKWLKRLGIRARSQSEAFEIYFAKHEHWNKGKGIRIHPDLHMGTDLAYILGVLRGDGWVSDAKNSWRIVLNQTREAFARSFEKALRNIGLNARTTVLAHKGLYMTRASSAEFVQWYKSLSLNQIEEMVQAKRDFEIAFIRGFYESEGSNVSERRGHVADIDGVCK